MELMLQPSESLPGFSTPAEFVVDTIVAILKRTTRWKRDGKSLRLLNKHWYLEISKQMMFIKLPQEEFLKEEDAQSLVNFPNLTSLDITAFCCTGQVSVLPDGCLHALRMMHQLPHLQKLIINVCVFSKMQKNDFNGLKLKSVVVIGGQVTSRDFYKVSSLPLEDFGCHNIERGCLARFVEATPLKRMSAAFSVIYSDDFRALNALEGVHIDYYGGRPVGLSSLTSLVSLHIRIPVDELGLFAELPKLKRLNTIIKNGDAFDDAFSRVLTRLTSLTLKSKTRFTLLPPRLREMATELEELDLEGFCIHPCAFSDHNLRSLCNLALRDYSVAGDYISFYGLTRLTALRMHCKLLSSRAHHPILIHPTTVKELRDLCIDLNKPPKMNEEFLKRLCQLTNLESLELRVQILTPSTCSSLELLEALPNLYKLVINGTATPEAILKLKNMQCLNDIDEFVIATTAVKINGL